MLVVRLDALCVQNLVYIVVYQAGITFEEFFSGWNIPVYKPMDELQIIHMVIIP